MNEVIRLMEWDNLYVTGVVLFVKSDENEVLQVIAFLRYRP